MTKTLVSRKLRMSGVAVASAAVLAWSCFGTDAAVRAGAAGSAQESPASAAPADLEKTFWLCDYAGTNGAVDSGAAIACSTITEELKNAKFNGDFEALVAWWRENKPARHFAIEAAPLASAFGN